MTPGISWRNGEVPVLEDEREGEAVSWFSWIKSLWGWRGGSIATIDPNMTADFDSLPKALTLHAGAARLRVGVVTTVGRYREHNEDNFFVPGLGTLNSPSFVAPSPRLERSTLENGQRVEVTEASALEPEGLFMVADGMGGQLAGEQASRIAVEIIPKELKQRLTPDDDDRATQMAVKVAVAAANREIIAQSHVMPEFNNMGTTVVLTLFRKDRVFVAGIGDSRVYRLRDDVLLKLTRDHDLATALIDAGTIKAEEAEHHRFKNVLYLYLGSPDARDGPEDVRIVDVQPGDKFLLASDGLTGVVRDPVVRETMARIEDPQESARALVDLALAHDSRDNVTCVVIHAE